MKKGNFVEIIGIDLLIVILFVLPVLMNHYNMADNIGAAYFAFVYIGPVLAALVGFMSGIVGRIPIFTSATVLAAGIVTMKIINCLWLFIIIPFVALYVGYLIGYVVRKCALH